MKEIKTEEVKEGKEKNLSDEQRKLKLIQRNKNGEKNRN